MSAKSNKIGVVQLTILTMVNMMGSGITDQVSRNWDYFHRFLACNSRWFNSLSLRIRTMRYVQ